MSCYKVCMEINEYRVFLWEGRRMDSLDRIVDKEEGGEFGFGVLGSRVSVGEDRCFK